MNTLDSGSRTNSFSVSYLAGLNKIQIQSNYPEVIYTVLTDADVLVDNGERFVETVDANNLKSINKVLGVYTTSGDASTNFCASYNRLYRFNTRKEFIFTL